MERKHKTLASVFLAAFLLVSIFAGSVHAELVGIDSAKDTGDYIYFLVLDSFGACNINPDTGEKYSDSEYDEITADSAADRCAGYGLRGGNFIFYIILPIVMAYIMLFAVMEQTRIFDKKTAKNMSIILSLLMVPLGVFRLIFVGLMSVLTGITVTLLYIFLFVLLIGWGYFNMYVHGKKKITAGTIHIEGMKHARERAKDIDGNIEKIVDDIKELDDKIGELEVKDKEKHFKEIVTLEERKEHLNKTLNNFIRIRDRHLNESSKHEADFHGER